MELTLKGVCRVYDYMNGSDKWEMVKFEASRYAKEYSREASYKRKDRHFILYKQLSRLQNELVKDNTHKEVINNINRIKAELDAFETVDAKRSAFRCRKEYVKSGEVSTKYFFNLEKRNYITKTMYVARRENGTLTKDYKEILQIQFAFFNKLYTRDPSTYFDVQNISGVKLEQVNKHAFEETISEAELYDALMTLKSGKVQGCDGLGLEFYRKFWKILCKPLHEMFVHALETDTLSPSARRGIINLIPKKHRDELEVQSWRGITILNYDYKLWAKAIANRLDCVSNELIGKQQYGFVRGRKITCNIRKTVEIIGHLNRSKQAGIVILIDFEKCFDRVSFESIRRTFQYFNFGDKFIQMLMLLYNDFKLCTVNNGYFSEFMTKGRGTNQGCPASPLVYTFCGEVMAHLIHQNNSIQGISLHNIKNILAQFADDTSAYLKYEALCVNAFVSTLQKVESQLGLKVSYEKTTIYRVGSLRNSEAQLYTQNNLQWSNGPIETLGVVINCDGTTDCKENLAKIMLKLSAVCENWYNRSLTLFGKALIINSLMGSLFVYKLFTVLTLNDNNIKEIEKVIRGFLWKGKKPKIALNTLMKKKEQGGLRLVNLIAKQDSIKIGWIFTIEDDIFLSECAYSILSKSLRQLIWRCNISEQDVKKCYDSENFWVQSLISWSKINFHTPCNKAEILNEFIWMNSYIRINDKPVIWNHWIEKGILKVEDLFDTDGASLTGDTLTVSWLELSQILSAIPSEWKSKILIEENLGQVTDLYNKLCSSKCRNREVYDMLIDDPKAVDKYMVTWNDVNVVFENSDDYKLQFKRLYQYTKRTKYRDFQYRLLLNKIVTNVDLHNWGKMDHDRCSFCGGVTETIVHILVECTHVKPLWECMFLQLGKTSELRNFDVRNIICSHIHETNSHVLNFVCTFIKQYVYKNKCLGKRISVTGMLNELEYYHEIEYRIAEQENRIVKHKKLWSPIVDFDNE